MEFKNIKYDNFVSDWHTPGFISGDVNVFFAHIANYFIKNPNQKFYINVNDITSINNFNDMGSESMKTFGIYSELSKGQLEDREYILVLPRVNKETLEKDIYDFCMENLPEGVIPNWYVVTDVEYGDIKDVQDDDAIINSVLPNCQNLLTYETLNYLAINEKFINQTKRYYGDVGLQPEIFKSMQGGLDKENIQVPKFVDITPFVEKLVDIFNTSENLNKMPAYFEVLVKNLATKYRKIVEVDKKKIIYYTTISSKRGINMYIYLAVTLRYMYNIECLIPKAWASLYQLQYSNLTLSDEYMTAERKLKYLSNFPTFNYMTAVYGFNFVMTEGYEGTVRGFSCAIEDLDNSKVRPELVENDIEATASDLISIEEKFNLNSKLTSQLVKGHNELYKLICKLEDKLDEDGEITECKLNLSNIIIYKRNGKEHIAYLIGIDFKIQTAIVSAKEVYALLDNTDDDNIEVVRHEFDLQDIYTNNILPVDSLYETDILKVLLVRILKSINSEVEINLAPVKFNHTKSLVFSLMYSCSGYKFITEILPEDVLTAGMFFHYGRRIKEYALPKLKDRISRASLRESGLNIFGNHLPPIVNVAGKYFEDGAFVGERDKNNTHLTINGSIRFNKFVYGGDI